MTKPRIYLAGPDVFRTDAEIIAEALRKSCEQNGLLGLFPLDGELDLTTATTPKARAEAIFGANVQLLDRCDAVVANLSPWRGPGADNGTAWEVGYAYARKLPVFGYSADLRPIKDRTPHEVKDERLLDPDGLLVEDFGQFDNLMIACSTISDCVSSAQIAIEMAAAHFRRMGRLA